MFFLHTIHDPILDTVSTKWSNSNYVPVAVLPSIISSNSWETLGSRHLLTVTRMITVSVGNPRIPYTYTFIGHCDWVGGKANIQAYTSYTPKHQLLQKVDNALRHASAPDICHTSCSNLELTYGFLWVS